MTPTGTQLYVAPEVLMGDAPAQPGDVWCVGICLYFMLSGSLPQGRDVAAVPRMVANRPIRLLHGQWLKVSEQCRSVVMMALALDAQQRPTAEELLQSTWFGQGM